ncbi:nucleic-acid-binding protein from transposon X-element [Trichonephila clavipes]|nr:nucleic-acid-binding protein from transposon X-element [Trichonephila clavipes]
MASNQDLTNIMELSLPSSNESTRPGTPTETNCERLISIKNDIEKFSIVVENTKAGLKTLLFAGIPESDPTILDHNRRLEEYQRLRQLAEGEFTSQPYCNTPGCTIHHTPSCSPIKPSQSLNKTSAIKRKDNEGGYTSPSSRQIAKTRRTTSINDNNFKIDLRNKFNNLRIEQVAGTSLSETANTQEKDTPNTTSNTNTVTNTKANSKLLPPPVFLEITTEYRSQMKVLNAKYPKLRSKMTGEYLKLYTDTDDEYYEIQAFLESIKYKFFSITPKKDRPIKVVIKGLPRDTDTKDIHSDLIDAGFTVLKVTQLIGKITKEKIPVFLVSLPRNITNAKIFELKKLSYLSVNVEGYESNGVTQCYSCNKFNHTADNCRLTLRCLKCGENHQTRECQIQRTENAFCINCQKFGHMANYAKCPLYPKQKKVTTSSSKNNYTSIVNSLVRPNFSYAQATNNNTSNQQQQMAPPVKEPPATKTQTQANRVPTPPQQVNANQNSNAALITQTLQGIIQALTTLTAQISNMNFNNNTPQPNKSRKSKNLKKRELCALIEAIYDDDDE